MPMFLSKKTKKGIKTYSHIGKKGKFKFYKTKKTKRMTQLAGTKLFYLEF